MRVFAVCSFFAAVCAVFGACAPDEISIVNGEVPGEGEGEGEEGEGEGEGEEGEGEEGEGEGEEPPTTLPEDPEIPPEQDPPAEVPEDPPPPAEPPQEPPPEPNLCPRVQVRDIGADPLNVRPQPNRTQAPIGTLRSFEIVDSLGTEEGEAINGDTTWFQIAKGSLVGYVSASFVDCTQDAPPVIDAPDGFLLPFECDKTVTVSQGNNSAFSHNGMGAFAFDFGVPRNTPILAAEDGIIEMTRGDVGPGDACYNGGGSACANTVNYVVLNHGDGSATLYLHLETPLVESGEIVRRGDVIAMSGGTGFSSGPHLHIQRQSLCGSWWCQSRSLAFADVGHTPTSGETVSSQNGCN